MKTTKAFTLLLAMAFFISCNHSVENSKDQVPESILQKSEPVNQNNDGINVEQKQKRNDSSAQFSLQDENGYSSNPAFNIDWDKKIIKNATLKFEVNNIDNYNKEVRDKVKKFGGYVAQEENFEFNDRTEVSLIIKIPVAQFEPALIDFKTKDVKQVERSIKTDDVTGQVVDTKSRLEAKKQMRLKYLEFLKQSKNMEEVLKVQAEINGIQEEIEAAQGRLQYLGNASAFSTINLNFYQPFENFTTSSANNNSFFKQSGEAFSRGAHLVKALMLVAISIWPLLLIATIVWLYWKRKKQIHLTVKK